MPPKNKLLRWLYDAWRGRGRSSGNDVLVSFTDAGDSVKMRIRKRPRPR